MPILGIDLGTTYSCAAYYDEKKVHVIPNPDGDLTTPSIVYFEEGLPIVGKFAQTILRKSTSKTVLTHIVHNCKRFIGKTPEEIDLKQFEMFLGQEVDTKEGLRYKIGDKFYTPVDISSFILRYIKTYSEAVYGQTFRQVVITVPAYFDESQRSATKQAALQAGFEEVVRMINEPTAASLAYGYEKCIEKSLKSEKILVLDTGGGTTDFSLVDLDYISNIYQVKNTFGDMFLGGEDITELLALWMWDQVKKKYATLVKEIEKSDYREKKVKAKLKTVAEKCKKELTFKMSTKVYLEAFYNDQDVELNITRVQLEETMKPFLDKLYNALDWIVKDSMKRNIIGNKLDIDAVLFIGGTSRIPIIKDMVERYFDNEVLILDSLNPDTTVAYGAAVQGFLLDDNQEESEFDSILLDIVPLSIGIELDGGIMGVIITRGSILPTTQSLEFQTSQNYLEEIPVEVYQGERRFVKDNFKLGSFVIKNITKALKGQVLITIEISVDLDGIYKVKGYETKNKECTEKQVILKSEKKDTKEITEMLMKADDYRFSDFVLSKKLERKIALYDKFMELLEIFQDRRDLLLGDHTEDPESSYTAYRFNTLFNKTWKVIETFMDYSVEELDNQLTEFTKYFYEALCEISEYDLEDINLSTSID